MSDERERGLARRSVGEGGAPSAVALRYDRGRSDAPQVVAKGRGEIAARIIEVAKRTGIEVVEDPDLLELLARVPVGREIPTELYQAVAEVLAFVYRVNGRYRQEREGAGDADGTPSA